MPILWINLFDISLSLLQKGCFLLLFAVFGNTYCVCCWWCFWFWTQCVNTHQIKLSNHAWENKFLVYFIYKHCTVYTQHQFRTLLLVNYRTQAKINGNGKGWGRFNCVLVYIIYILFTYNRRMEELKLSHESHSHDPKFDQIEWNVKQLAEEIIIYIAIILCVCARNFLSHLCFLLFVQVFDSSATKLIARLLSSKCSNRRWCHSSRIVWISK